MKKQVKKQRIVLLTVLVLLVLGSTFLLLKQLNKDVIIEETNYKKPQKQQSEEKNLCKEYGITLDSFNIVTGRVNWNDNIASMLSEWNVSRQKISTIASVSEQTFDISKIRAGHKYKLFLNKDSANSVRYFVYEHTPADYILIDFKDSVHIEKQRKDVKVVKKTCKGIINSSLWETLTQQNINPHLAIELSEIYAWTIDFFRIAEGDRFKVIYEEKYVDTNSIGIGKIYAASFKHLGEKYYAVPFVQDSTLGYYDSTGQSLEREFLKAPVHYKYISSGYSNSRYHPVLKTWRPHHGIDYAAPYGTPVRSIGDGTIMHATYSKGEGRWVKVRHNSVYTTAYLHLSRFKSGIHRGARVKQGEIIGYVGSSGYSTGPHLDFRFWKNGHPVNPMHVEAPPVEPIKPQNKQAYDSVRRKVFMKLAEIRFDSKKEDKERYQAYQQETQE